MVHALIEERFGLYENVKKLFDEWFAAKRKIFTGVVYTNCLKGERNVNKRWNIL